MSALPVALHGRPRGFIDWHPQPKTIALLDQVQAVLAEYQKHLPLTLRQAFYRLVGKYTYPKTERDYKALGEVLNRARRARLIDFSAIRDDGMTRMDDVGWIDVEDCRDAIRSTADDYHIDRQRGQPRRVVLWCEAAGMAPQLERVGKPYSAPVYSSGGFDSVTVKHDMAETFADRPTLVLHVGDHDPSGVHIYGSLVADIQAFGDELSADVEFSRLAVLPEHIVTYDLPTAPPKVTDHRAFTGQTVQAEALPPDVLAQLVLAGITSNLDLAIYQNALVEEQAEREELRAWLEGH